MSTHEKYIYVQYTDLQTENVRSSCTGEPGEPQHMLYMDVRPLNYGILSGKLKQRFGKPPSLLGRVNPL